MNKQILPVHVVTEKVTEKCEKSHLADASVQSDFTKWIQTSSAFYYTERLSYFPVKYYMT